MAKWTVGDTPRLQCYFRVSGTLTDPSTVSLKTEDPSGNITTYTYGAAEITKDATGDYHKDVNLDEEGTWHWRWVGTGTVAAADEGELEVTRSEFA